ncbi:MAG: hypothetical protein WBD20_02540 [Pirellulaceae bacterium]
MRLTLRTLLAYLDNTLDPKDAEALRAKLAESGFATQLVQRIRATLVNPNLSAPSPDAVSPIDEANVISEYLDSTLSPEQIAEVEKACLESDPHLAEAAACHQILTMVLGKPAHVSEALRDRIYQLPDRAIQDIATAASGSFSGVSLPEVGDLPGVAADPSLADQPVGESVLQSSLAPVTPVGAGDSGVSDAPKRLREATSGEPDSHRRARMAAEDMYGGSIRPSRITPWLVSLALAGVFLFALSRVLAPLMDSPVAQKEEKIGSMTSEYVIDDPPADVVGDSAEEASVDSAADGTLSKEIEVPASKAPVMETVGTPGVEIRSSEEAEIMELPMPAPDAVAKVTADPDVSTLPEEMSDPIDPIDMPAPVDLPTPSDAASEMPAPDKVAVKAGSDVEPKKMTDASGDEPPSGKDLAKDAAMSDTDVDPDKTATDKAATDKAGAKAADDVAVAKAITDETILLAASTTDETFDSAMWAMVKKDMMISRRATLINSPKFRSTVIMNSGTVVTLVDATKVGFVAPQSDTQSNGLKIDYGRILIKSRKADLAMPLEMLGQTLELRLPSPDTTVAIEVSWLRQPGFDPFLEKNHIPIARIVAIADPAGLAGEVELTTPGGDVNLVGDQQWMVRGQDPPKVMELPELIGWAEIKEPDDSILDKSAREGLLALVAQPQPLDVSLREATGFRQSEVASLAAQLMLHLGQADVFFGTDGILSQAKQRSFWPDHFRALRAAVDRNPATAASVQKQIEQMDAANGKNLFRLLIGFSQSQLVENSDEDLIEMIDSESMAVRVLATENLREITGTTMNFWAGEDNAVRRVPAIKKWQVRLRKGDIRWQNGG